MKKSKIIIIGIVAIIAIGVFYLLNKKNIDSDSVKIGVIMPLTGPVAEPGQNALRGIELAIDLYNDSTTSKKIGLIIEDSKSSNKDGVLAMNKLAHTNVKIVIGDIMSSVFLSCAPIAEKNKIVMISPGASNPAVRDAGDYIFRNYLSDDFDGKVMANYIFDTLIKKNVAVIYVNNDYGIGVAKMFIENFKRKGGSVILEETYAQGQTDYKGLMIKLKEKNPEIVYIVGNPAENGNIVRQMRENNIKTSITGNLSFENNEFINIAKGAFDSIIFSTLYYNPDSEDENMIHFLKEYEKTYNAKPDIASALAYDVANILIKCLIENNYDVSKLKETLYNTSEYPGLTGKTTFDDHGDVYKDIYIKEIKGDGTIRILEQFFIGK